MRDRTFHAACRCGTVRYAVDAVPRLATPCICPRCRGQGVRNVHVEDPDSFVLLAGEDMLTEPMDGARQPHHFFCRRCGEAVFGLVALPEGGRRVTVNAACLTRGNVEALAVPGRSSTLPKKWEV
jgi:hypothetical protein